MFVCVPPGTYKAFADIDVNVDGLLVSAPSGASIVFGTANVQFFLRGDGNTIQNLNFYCDNSAASGFVITGGGNFRHRVLSKTLQQCILCCARQAAIGACVFSPADMLVQASIDHRP